MWPKYWKDLVKRHEARIEIEETFVNDKELRRLADDGM
jgi:hypothetical protein